MPFADLTDVRCYFEMSGRGDPLLLIPGLGNNCRFWDPVAQELSHHFSLIMPDIRGMGRSTARRVPHTLRDYAADLLELLDHLRVERSHVLGISLGGMIAQRLAIEHSSRVDKLVLISCAHHFGPYLRGTAALLAHILRRFPPKLYLSTIEMLAASPVFYDQHQDLIEQRQKLQQECTFPSKGVLRQLQCLGRSDLPESQYRIPNPTLVISGEFDALIPHIYGRRMADDIPDSRFLLIPQTGHNPLLENPDVTLAAIIQFLKEHAYDRIDQRGQKMVSAR